MFDVRPVDKSGDLDMEKISKMEKILSIPGAAKKPKEDRPSSGSKEYLEKKERDREIFKEIFLDKEDEKESLRREVQRVYCRPEEEDDRRKKDPPFSGGKTRRTLNVFKKRWKISLALFVVVLAAVFISNLAVRGIQLKNQGIPETRAAMGEMLSARDSLKSGDFEKAYSQFSSAQKKLSQVSDEFSGLGRIFISTAKYVPYLSKVSSGAHLIAAGDDVSQAGALVSGALKNLDALKNGKAQGASISYLNLFHDNEDKLKQVSVLLDDAENNLDSVNVDDVPEENRAEFLEMKKTLPEANKALAAFLGQEKILNDILGGNGPRKYLFLFQNNQEMRATGGFIGTYGLLDIFEGHVRKFFIDGIFNPDGQLKTRIVPPGPIQKISANWSLHDSNWFPNFPTSAEKAAWFYEKSGGPTVDGVITMTPTVMQKLLEVTGPIEMPEYGVTVDKDNFIQDIQYQVEVDYDKELNQPKKILGDLAPKILDRILNMKSFTDMQKALNVLLESLNEKQILIYSRNPAIEKVLSQNNWSGEVLNTPKDYLSVINTNINGFKTDGVIDEKIAHKAQIQKDGSIIDTVTITRHHNGGDTPYEWWNQVNADYMRVYVPLGSKLLSADGQTREIDSPPLDYDALGYARDKDVQAEEDSMQTDPETGTKIYEDAGKTVFANWTYVSPKETMTIKYTYLLPFKLKIDPMDPTGTYSLLAQKQSGSLGSGFSCEVDYPSDYKTIWQSPENDLTRPDDLPSGQSGVKMETDLKTDRFIGLAFSR